MKFVSTTKGMTKKKFSSVIFVAVFGPGIGDPGSGMGNNQDPGSGINILDQQHWNLASKILTWGKGGWGKTTNMGKGRRVDKGKVSFNAVSFKIFCDVDIV